MVYTPSAQPAAEAVPKDTPWSPRLGINATGMVSLNTGRRRGKDAHQALASLGDARHVGDLGVQVGAVGTLFYHVGAALTR